MDMGPNEAVVVKGGINWITYSFRRGKKGLEINVKAVPEVEDFVKALGDGRNDAVEMYHRYWYTPEKAAPILIYKMDRQPAPQAYPQYRIDIPGQDLLYDGVVNLSFLRCVGISEDAGVTFGVKGAYSLPGIFELRDNIGRATKSFLKDFVVPARLVVQLYSQEVIGVGA